MYNRQVNIFVLSSSLSLSLFRRVNNCAEKRVTHTRSVYSSRTTLPPLDTLGNGKQILLSKFPRNAQ